ncbi:helix-turn-helix transcriptional regulator [Aureimonas sp. Leaf324]|jgi:transcriptional regulator with XRE-family HTH domain|uniref:helix-turn-helix domain-containing protein n=1 Tax=Aureimonas TaxID=414371 RepID=UPI0006FF0FDD|nr:helix-turn-helix transcriptional regulator [Aureimonas sp. Leaf324]KQQ84196.1 hypothetical protein ASF65_20335 [Aureimonas sp. Leaf324]
MPVDPNLLRAARLLADLSLEDLAEKAKVARRSLLNMEAGKGDCMLSTMENVKQALEAAGVVFIGETEFHGPGLRVTRDVAAGWTRTRSAQARSRKKKKVEAPG